MFGHLFRGLKRTATANLRTAGASRSRKAAPGKAVAQNALPIEPVRGDAAELLPQALLHADPDALGELGNTLRSQGRLEEAGACYRRVLDLAPDNVGAHFGLGEIFKARGEFDKATGCHQKVLELLPDSPIAHSNLGNMLVEQGRLDEAITCYRKALELDPAFPEACSNLAGVLRDLGRLTEAMAYGRKAIALKPDLSEAHLNLGNALKDAGRPEQAVSSYREALALRPDAQTHSNLLFALNHVPGLGPAEIYAEHRAYERRFCAGGAPLPHRNAPDPECKLRVGYVSGDFRAHPVAHFIEPVIAGHDRERFEVFCYYNHGRADAVTERLRNNADRWRDIFSLGDEAFADLVRDDAIDILVDLSGHTGKNRLPAFGRKPAPVQATWLGYLNTTGLEAVDYRITDRYASPEGLLDAFHSERLWRLPDSQWCYQPPENCPDVDSEPSAGGGAVMFAAFSNLAKIGPPVVELWSELLLRVPNSRLLLVCPGLGSAREDYLARFACHAVAADRLDLQEVKPFREYLALHAAADIVLDTFPYTGGTTTCHALWMGVPVVSLVGDTAPSRGGASVLNAIGLGELVARTPDEYLDIAAELAGNTARLAALRSGMRARMLASPLMNAPLFARNLEQAYRSMWTSWCAKQ